MSLLPCGHILLDSWVKFSYPVYFSESFKICLHDNPDRIGPGPVPTLSRYLLLFLFLMLLLPPSLYPSFYPPHPFSSSSSLLLFCTHPRPQVLWRSQLGRPPWGSMETWLPTPTSMTTNPMYLNIVRWQWWWIHLHHRYGFRDGSSDCGYRES